MGDMTGSAPDPTKATSRPPWGVFRGDHKPRTDWMLPKAPGWRRYGEAEPLTYRFPEAEVDITFQPDAADVEMVNAALYLRRPLLVTGRPGSGKSSLARAVAHELGLGRVLVWPINSRSTLLEGLYRYDAIGRLQDASRRQTEGDKEKTSIGRYLKLGPLGTALLPTERPRVLLIDEFDKSDIDLPNDLLHVFEAGRFEVAELGRAAKQGEELAVMPFDSDKEVVLESAEIRCREFPLVILTSNAERDFPAAFLRRCLRLDMKVPPHEQLNRIVQAHFQTHLAQLSDDKKKEWEDRSTRLIERFLELRAKEVLATDQLLNALYFVQHDMNLVDADRVRLLDAVLRGLAPSM